MNKKSNILVLITIIIIAALCACKEADTEKAQAGTIEVQLDDMKFTVAVKGDSFTGAEWNTIKNQLVTAIQDGFTTGDQGILLDVLAGRPEFVINVDKTPSGYTNWKTISDAKTLYIANGKITAKNIQDGIGSVFTGVPETGQVIQTHDLCQSIAFANGMDADNINIASVNSKGGLI